MNGAIEKNGHLPERFMFRLELIYLFANRCVVDGQDGDGIGGKTLATQAKAPVEQAQIERLEEARNVCDREKRPDSKGNADAEILLNAPRPGVRGCHGAPGFLLLPVNDHGNVGAFGPACPGGSPRGRALLRA